MACGCTPPPGSPGSTCSREAGYAPSRPGLARRRRHRRGRPAPTPRRIADHGIDDVVAHYAGDHRRAADAKPILIGHSFGGMIAQKLLGQDLAAAAVAIDAAQIKGVLPLPLSALRATLPVFKNPANKHRAVSLTAEQFRYASATRSRRRSPTRCTSAGPSRRRAGRCSRPRPPTSTRTRRRRSTPTTRPRGPLLLITGGKDHTVPEAVTQRDAQAVPALRRGHRPRSSSPTAATR